MKLFQNANVATTYKKNDCRGENAMNQKLERFMMKELIAIMAGMAILSALPLAVVIVGS